MPGYLRQVVPLKPHDPQRLGRHRLLGRLGAGGMGVVYLGEGPLGKVAVKVVRDELAGDQGFRLRFQREVQSCFRVSGPWTARLLDFDTTADQPWLATEFIDAPDLQQVIEASGPMSPDQQVRTAFALAQGLESLHAFELVHRDLKPSNVLFPSSGPKIIDFGIASALEDIGSLTATSNILGSPAWMAPEQILLGQTGMPSDIYAWGALVVFTANGKSLSGNNLPRIMANAASPAPEIDLQTLEAGLRPSVAAALDRDPLKRPTAAALVAALRELPALAPSRESLNTSDETRWVTPAPPPEPPETETPRRPGRGKLLAAAGGVVVVAAVVLGIVLGSGQKGGGDTAAASIPATAKVSPAGRASQVSPTSTASPAVSHAAVAFRPVTGYADLVSRLPASLQPTCDQVTTTTGTARARCRIGEHFVQYTGFATAAELTGSIGYGDKVPDGCEKGLSGFINSRQHGGYNTTYADGARYGLANCSFEYIQASSFSSISWTDTALSIAGFMSSDSGDEAGYQSLYTRWLQARHFAAT